ncbi:MULTISPECIES: NAD-dependent epimerase/dehydratase family protein [unclassified Aminobacter]|uniref:NAD-dependent epimerase/dehydratase family protein n=1 Tax=unclassified Aminobacter TaxID=2644704 RepID=UPI000465A24D|nr:MULTISPECIES: NAD-dependent epimerase/dehydratase family protein [unclassified Aminobacter]TWH28755.1 UDP-glucose 4-epimerase [Aminobacter sp. J15]
MERILITGASGYIGKALVSKLLPTGVGLTLALRRSLPHGTASGGQVNHVVVGDISDATDWSEALRDCGTVVHLAGQTPGRGVDDERFYVVNDKATSRLTEQAVASGVRVFVMMSSIAAVVGHAADSIITDDTYPVPTSAYGRSKLAAESHVAKFSLAGGIGVSLRPPMVYGAAAGGNWRLLQKLAASNLPLPFGAIRNQRAMISIDNLVDAILAVISTINTAPSGAFAVADSKHIGLAEMLRLLREGMKLPARLVSCPPSFLSASLQLIGKGAVVDSLLGDLVVDSSRFCETFSWMPAEDIRNGMRRAGAEYIAGER